MIAELGHFSIILAVSLAVLQLIVYRSNIAQINIMRPLALGQTFFVCLAFSILSYSFLHDDFSLLYVAQNSNSSLPIYYKFTAIWGAHEGSLLLWVLILSLWALAIAICARNWPLAFSNKVLAIFAAVNLGFLSLLIWTSNPFARTLSNIPLDGNDLNPLLQDFGMIIHPPILYMGYVGCTVAFAFAIAALLQGNVDETWARRLRPWVLMAWSFLTLGIALGSWWAYYELGWGGWWFWDPVENASFMPWLTATALLHCLAISKQNGQMLRLAIFLCIITFILSLLGTFLVRSGSIISVHAFAQDPQRGMFIMNILGITILAATILFIARAPNLQLPDDVQSFTKTGMLILTNNVLLLVGAGIVLLGTLFPMLHETITGTAISVGYPYFNLAFIPVMLLMFGIMIYGMLGGNKNTLLICTLCFVIACTFLYFYFGTIKYAACIGITFALAIIVTCFKGKNLAMSVAHLGLAITTIGISIVPGYEIEKDLRLQVGDQISLQNYTVVFKQLDPIDGPNYVGFKGAFTITKSATDVATLYPEKRIYLVHETAMSETAILPGILQDIYIALGQRVASNAWSVRIYYKPFVRWIWLGAIIMALGAGIAVISKFNADRRLIK